MKAYYVYVVSSLLGTIYIGVTNNLQRRIYEHKQHLVKGFTDLYNCTQLVYYEEYNNVNDAIAREKQLKGWKRSKKEALIRKVNPGWEDLSNRF